VRWESGDSAVVYVRPNDAGVVALDTGATTLTAHLLDIPFGIELTATASVHVARNPIVTIAAVPASTILHPGEVVGFQPHAKDGDGVTITSRPITWTSADPTVATVAIISGNLDITGVSVGSTMVTATCDGYQQTLVVDVHPPPTVASVVISPSRWTLAEGAHL